MSQDTKSEKSDTNIVKLRPNRATRASEAKWGKAVMERGFCILPSLIFRAQQRLGLNPTQLVVLLQLCDFWWDEGRKPYPSKGRIAERIDLSERQVQRYIAELEKAGFVERIERRASHGGKLTNEYDLSGLVEKLKRLEPEFREVEQEVRERRQAVSRPRGRQKPVPNTAANNG